MSAMFVYTKIETESNILQNGSEIARQKFFRNMWRRAGWGKNTWVGALNFFDSDTELRKSDRQWFLFQSIEFQ